MFDLIALGELLIDYTPYGTSENGMHLLEQNPGGAPANVLAVASKLQLSTAFIGKVGNDVNGRFLKQTLDSLGINTSGLLLDDNVYTTLAFVSLSAQGERNFSFARKPGADTMLNSTEVRTELIKQSKMLHIGSLSLTNEPSRSATFHALQKAKDFHCTISYDPNYRKLLWPNEKMAINIMQSVLPYVDLIKLSDEETHLLTPYADHKKAASHLLAQGIQLVAITLGSAGVYVATNNGTAHIPGIKTHVIDTTGAGDTFWGAFLYQIISSNKQLKELSLNELSQFARFANAAASLCIEKHGAIPAIPSFEQIIKRLG